MPLDVAKPTPLPPLLSVPDLTALLSPAENIVHGYNMAEQTCFHITTVGNVIPAFSRLSAVMKGLQAIVQPVTALLSSATTLVTDALAAVGLTRTLLTATTTVVTAATTLIGTVLGFVTTVIGLVTGIIGSLGGIATACTVAGILTIVAGVLFGFGFVGVGGIALTALLAVFFFVVASAVSAISGALGTLLTALGTLTTPLGALTGALGPLNTAIGALNGILSNPVLPSDVTRSLTGVSTALTDLQTALTASGLTTTLGTATTTLDQRVSALRTFLVRPAGQGKVARAHLNDARTDAVAIYNAGITEAQATSMPVWNAMRGTVNNTWQMEPMGVLDKTLTCPAEHREG